MAVKPPSVHKVGRWEWQQVPEPPRPTPRKRPRQTHRKPKRDPERSRTQRAAKLATLKRRRIARVQRTYGTAYDEAERWASITRCQVCGRAGRPKRALCVDHDHATGDIRGVLCSRCNSALGLMGDSPRMVGKLWRYATRTASTLGQRIDTERERKAAERSWRQPSTATEPVEPPPPPIEHPTPPAQLYCEVCGRWRQVGHACERRVARPLRQEEP